MLLLIDTFSFIAFSQQFFKFHGHAHKHQHAVADQTSLKPGQVFEALQSKGGDFALCHSLLLLTLVTKSGIQEQVSLCSPDLLKNAFERLQLKMVFFSWLLHFPMKISLENWLSISLLQLKPPHSYKFPCSRQWLTRSMESCPLLSSSGHPERRWKVSICLDCILGWFNTMSLCCALQEQFGWLQTNAQRKYSYGSRIGEGSKWFNPAGSKTPQTA